MQDKSLTIFLMLLFGISGIAVLALTWLQPAEGAERLMSTFLGSIGIISSLFWAISLKCGERRKNPAPVTCTARITGQKQRV